MHRQADNLARAARALMDSPAGYAFVNALDPLRAALLAYDAARQDTLRLATPAEQRGEGGCPAFLIRPTGDRSLSVVVRAHRRDTSTDVDLLAVADLARRIAASVNLLAHVPLDSLERLDGMSDAPAVLAAKVRGMQA